MKKVLAAFAVVSGMICAATALSTAALADDTTAMQAAQGKVAFAHNCAGCHSLDTSKNAFGPSLIGVVGRKAGAVPRFDYSDAVKKSGVTWTPDNLRKWIAGNDAFIPGTRMRHVAITDPATQDYLLAFLGTLK